MVEGKKLKAQLKA